MKYKILKILSLTLPLLQLNPARAADSDLASEAEAPNTGSSIGAVESRPSTARSFTDQSRSNNTSSPADQTGIIQTSIVEQTERGDHLQAVVSYDQIEHSELQASLSDRLSAAKSAWALGLPVRARLAWDQALDDPKFQGAERTRAQLGRAIMELQERNFEEARSIAERAVSDASVPGIRAQLHLVIAESLREQGALNLATEYYKKARDEGDKNVANEAGFLLGETQIKLGQFTDARYSFTAIELGAPFAAQAIRRLAEIDLTQKNYEGVLTWIQEGRENHFQEVDDAWSQYALVAALCSLDRGADAQAELKTFQARYSEQNGWYLLAQAAVETKLAEGIQVNGGVANGGIANGGVLTSAR